MATNTTDIVAEHWFDAEEYRPQPDRPNGKNGSENGAERDTATLALAPLVDKIAYGFARGLVVALKELENHIASETRKVGESVGRRLDTLQASFQDLTGAVAEQRALNTAFQERCQSLEAASVSLREADAKQTDALQAVRAEASERLAALQETDSRHAGELTAIRAETQESSAALHGRIDALCRELGVQQEDMEAVKSALGGVSTRVDGVVERLDRQADALRSIYSTYAQRETELEQLVDGLARLRSHAAPAPVKAL
jgi:chromosome segregation ATPase